MGYTSQYESSEPDRAEIDAIAGPVVVEFGAPWCGYCQASQPAILDALQQHPDVKHIKIYDGRGKPLGRSFRVKLWPTLVLMRDGKVLAILVRPSDREIVQALANAYAAPV